MKLTDLFIHRPVLAVVVSLLITIAGVQAIRTRGVATAVLAVVMLAAMVLVKNPGKAWLLTLVPTFIAAALPRYGVRIAAAVLGLSIFALLVVTRLGVTILGYQFTNKFALPWDALFDNQYKLTLMSYP